MRKLLSLISVLCATSAVFASENKTFERSVDSNWEHASKQYSPPIIANGDIGLLIDYRNCQFQDVSSYKYIKSISQKFYVPSIYRAGRRLDNKELACFGRIEESVNFASGANAQPEKWTQNLDIFNAVSEVINTYNSGKTTIASTAFVSANSPVIAIQKRFSGESPKSYVFEYAFKSEKDNEDQPLHMLRDKALHPLVTRQDCDGHQEQHHVLPEGLPIGKYHCIAKTSAVAHGVGQCQHQGQRCHHSEEDCHQ